MIERTVKVETITITASGDMFVLFSLRLVEGGTELSRANHRTVVPTDTSVADQIAHVNAHLGQLGWPEVSANDIARLRRFHMIEGRG